MTRFTVNLSFKTGSSRVVTVEFSPTDDVPTLEGFVDGMSGVLNDEDEVLQFQQNGENGRRGILLVPVRSISTMHVS